MNGEPNPYAPPTHDSTAVPRNRTSEEIRREHINAEANVKAVGLLMLLGVVFSVVSATHRMRLEPNAALAYLVMGGVLGLGGYWLWRLDRRGRVAYSIMAMLDLARAAVDTWDTLQNLFQLTAFDMIVTLLGWAWPIFLLTIVWAEKASTVLTPHYRDVVIPATPHVKGKISIVLIMAGGGFVLIVLSAVLLESL